MIRRFIALGATASVLALGAALPASAAPAPASYKPAVTTVTTHAPAAAPSDASHETVKPAARSLKAAKGIPVRPQVTYDGQHWITTNIVLASYPDYYQKVLWYWDSNECGTSTNYCWVPKAIEGGSDNFLACALDRIDADYIVGASTLVQRIGKAFANPSNPGTANFTSGAWSFDAQDPRVNGKLTTDAGPGCTPASWELHATTRN